MLRISAVAALLIMGVIGCGKSGSESGGMPDSTAFASAPADAKAQWQLGVAAVKTNGYITAWETFSALKMRQDLSAQQRAAAEKALANVNDSIFEGAGNGDPKAAEALKQIKQTMGR